jgi:hypothetical protein
MGENGDHDEPEKVDGAWTRAGRKTPEDGDRGRHRNALDTPNIHERPDLPHRHSITRYHSWPSKTIFIEVYM